MMKTNLRFIGRSTIILLLILAAIFLRGNVRDFTVLGILVAVVTYNLFVFFRPKWMLSMQQYEQQRDAAKATKPRKEAPPQPPQAVPAQPPQVSATSAPVSVAATPLQDNAQANMRDTLIRHVNYRITSKLKGVYPEATWSWCIKDPALLIQNGGATRIRTFHTDGHDFAEVEFSPNGDFRICMVQITELDGNKKAAPKSAGNHAAECDPDNINLYDWYELTASAVIQGTIDEVHTRGHQVLYIDASGDVFTKEGEESVRQGKISFMPSAKLWDELLPLFACDDIGATIDGDTLALTWGN